MNKLKDKSEINRITILFVFVYMVSYMTRINYGAIISEMVRATGIPKSLLSMGLTGSFITYGIGQIVSGIFGDRISPKCLISCGFGLTILMNMSMVFMRNPFSMMVIWSINGFAQSLMWPPIVKILTVFLAENDYKRVVTKVCWGSSVGTMLIYLISPVIISVSQWRYVFLFSAMSGIVMFLIWEKSSSDFKVQKGNRREEKNETGGIGNMINPMILAIMVSIIFQGMLKDGITTWMPSYIAETYHLSNVISILSGVILPVFSIVCMQIAAIF